MGHAVHFLQRLDRVRDHEVELALTLYRDEELLRGVLEGVSLPDGADRVAISLDDPHLGPFVVVTRLGKFVTCLARGMSATDLPIVSRERIEIAGSRIERMRERLGRLRDLVESGAVGEASVAFERMQRRGPRFAREDAHTLLHVLPLIARDALLALSGTLEAASKGLRDALRLRIDRLSRVEEDALLALSDLLWGANNLLVIAGPIDLRAHEPALFDDLGTAPLAWASTAASSGMVASLLRGSWVAAQLGKPAVIPIKQRRGRTASVSSRLFLEMALGAIACASTKARAEARKALGAPWVGTEEAGEAFAGFMRGWLKLLELAIDEPARADEAFVASARQLAAVFLHQAPSTPEREAAIPEDVARAFLTTLSVSVLHSDAGAILHQVAPLGLPWLAKAKPEELVLPQAWTNRLVSDHRSLPATLDWLEPVLRRAPTTPFVREAKTVGRNDPCSCGSGLKFKRCCG